MREGEGDCLGRTFPVIKKPPEKGGMNAQSQSPAMLCTSILQPPPTSPAAFSLQDVRQADEYRSAWRSFQSGSMLTCGINAESCSDGAAWKTAAIGAQSLDRCTDNDPVSQSGTASVFRRIQRRRGVCAMTLPPERHCARAFRQVSWLERHRSSAPSRPSRTVAAAGNYACTVAGPRRT